MAEPQPESPNASGDDPPVAPAHPTAQRREALTDPSPVNLSLGVQVGALLGVSLFAGMYSLCAHELRIAATIFLTGVALSLVGWIVAVLTTDTLHLQRMARGRVEDDVRSAGFWQTLFDGLGLGLGILLGTLPISLACSLFYRDPTFPEIVYVVAGIILIAVGVVRAPSLRSLPSSVAYALLPGLAGVLVGHFAGDFLSKNMILLLP